MPNTKPTINVWFYPEQMDKFESLANNNRHSNAATLKYMLEDYLSGKLQLPPLPTKKGKEERKLVSTQVSDQFKDKLKEKLEETGLSLPELVMQLLKAKIK